ncbi:MAG: glycoside hydrolase, partial [Prevotella sp.]|nr:glycoside hydrolase [Prevotella sp.]
YNYTGKPCTLDLTKISGAKKNLWVMNPKDGSLNYLGEFADGKQEVKLDVPHANGSDRVIIAIDAEKDYIKATQTALEEKF